MRFTSLAKELFELGVLISLMGALAFYARAWASVVAAACGLVLCIGGAGAAYCAGRLVK